MKGLGNPSGKGSGNPLLRLASPLTHPSDYPSPMTSPLVGHLLLLPTDIRAERAMKEKR